MHSFKNILIFVINLLITILPTKHVEKPFASNIVEQLQLKGHDCFAIVRKQYEQSFAQEERALWQEFEHYGISYEAVRQEKERIRADMKENAAWSAKKYAQDCQPLQPSTITTIQTILKKLGINPEEIIITPWNYPSGGATMGNFIVINEQILLAKSSDEQHCIIGHEIIHYHHEDHLTREALNNLLKASKASQEISDKLMQKLSTFHEIRADILGALYGPEFTIGSKKFFSAQLKMYGDFFAPGYPRNSERLAFAQEIHTKIYA